MQESITINLKAKMLAGSLIIKLKNLFSYCQKYKFTGKLDLNIFWYVNQFSRYDHYEDVESWMERADYLIKMMNINAIVTITHHLTENKNHTPFEVVGHKNITSKFLRKTPRKPFFKTNLQTQKNKVCFWRYDINALPYQHHDPNESQRFKREKAYTLEEWCELYTFLNDNYNVVEVNYRTPIREVFYHLSTCELTVGYGGMWHLLSAYLDKPMISLMNQTVTAAVPELHKYEYVCLPTIEQITDINYFQSLIKKANRTTRLLKTK